MRGILIDPFTRTIEEVETTGKLPEIYSMLGVELITIVHVGETDVLFLDDEGLFVPREEQEYFYWKGSNQPYAGKGLIIGTDEEGDSTDAEATLWEVMSQVHWLDKSKLNPEEYLKTEVFVLEGETWRQL